MSTIQDYDDPFANIKEDFEDEDSDNIFDSETQFGELQKQSLLKPIFVPKQGRETQMDIIENEIINVEEKKKLIDSKKQLTNDLVIQVVRQNTEEESMKPDEDLEEMPDDDDEVDKEKEYELWKIRELKRLKKEKDEKEKLFKEQEERERRRNLTDEQRKIEDDKAGKYQKIEKSHYQYMQKYYHKGAFYLDKDDAIFKRDYNIGVDEDNFDKSNLPKILQKRRGNLGKKGQSKYTDLRDQDTTNFDPNYKVFDVVYEKNLMKQAGYKNANDLEKPNKRKQFFQLITFISHSLKTRNRTIQDS